MVISRYIGTGQLQDLANNRTFKSNETSVLSKSFASISMFKKWQDCCQNAQACCTNFLRHSTASSIKQNCPKTWDGWSCFSDDTPIFSESHQSCPEHIYWQRDIPSCRG